MRSTINNVTNNFVGARYEVDKTSGDTVARAVTYYPAKTSLHLNNLFFLSYKNWNSPYINRFLQPDTIVPGAANPQALNRYSYVLGNPLKYTDPTGHYCVGDDEDCADEGGDGPALTGTSGNNGNGGGGGGDPHDDDDYDPNPSGLPAPNPMTTPNVIPYCASGFLTCAAIFSQDAATAIDFIFAGVEVVLVTEGCLVGPEGCAGGLLASWMVFNLGPNQLESALSGISLALTVAADYEDGALGESSFTSAITFLTGGINPDPIADLVIDGYASGYNHGFFNGIGDIINGEPFLQSP